jgi:Bacterial PH domain
MSGEHEFEAVRGLPGDLPQGEKILWQGAPDWFRLSIEAFKISWVGVYFALLIGWRFVDKLNRGEDPIASLTTAFAVMPLALIAVAILCGLAWVNARSTVYTITDKRIVMRFGAALTKAINIPFTIIESACADVKKDGGGTVAVKLVAPNKIPLLLLWPHRKPRTFARPEPAFCAIKDAANCAPILAEALRIAHAQSRAVGGEARVELDNATTCNNQPALA